MKKFLILLLAVVPFLSCEDIETNDVALQAKINNRLYQSTDVRATLEENEGVVIRGTNVDEALTLKLNDLREGIFNLRTGTSNSARFEDAFGNVFKTNPEGEGTVEISEVDLVNGTITGTFNFSAMMPGVDTVYVSRGVIYRVPFGVDLPDADTGDNEFRAKIDGDDFVPVMIVTNSGLGSIMISGVNGEKGIALSMPIDIETGEYDVMNSEIDLALIGFGLEEGTTGGNLLIDTHDPETRKIKGTFSFNSDNHEVTNGEFIVTYEGE